MNMNSHAPIPDADLRARCSAYLLGELDELDSTQFESELANPVVAEALAVESDLLVALASSPRLTSPVSNVPETTAAKDRSPTSLRQLSLLISALAATLVFAALYPWTGLDPKPGSASESAIAMAAPPTPSDVPFDLQVAKTWVDPAIDWQESATATFLAADNETVPADEGTLISSTQTDADEDFEWLVAAVEVTLQTGDQTQQGDPNDG